ncbi:unnamed protein product [Echinostoma caproni]|uniref:ANK_REP_REGION domain-containing protein n=1 Tax=Echinostoma caproni TaxID=27848 RepID=A0A183ATJ2_9TREM|nr:unnamed protein product [Echinostoma caproni]
MSNYHWKQPLHEAAQTSQTGYVAFPVDAAQVPINFLKRADWTSLMLACVNPGRMSATNQSDISYIECARILLSRGADPTFTNKDGWNCLQV